MILPGNRGAYLRASILSVLVFVLTVHAYGADWTLGAQKFSFAQNGIESASQDGAASLIPQLILEQISTVSTRVPTNRELLNRTLDDLQTKRLSLFLQLSKEVKTRDAIFLTEADGRNRKKKITDEQVKIASLQKQIDDNLALADKARADFEPSMNAVTPEQGNPQEFSFEKIFGSKKNMLSAEQTENVVLYKKDAYTLFAPAATAIAAGVKSYEFDKAVTAEKINGLITGTITVYGTYAAVNAELLVYPGAISAGTVTEVGSLDNCQQIAQNIARSLSPKLFNNLPISVYFDIQPEEAAKNATITVDGTVYDSVPQTLSVQAGIHTVTIESEEFNAQSVTWNFKDVPSFLIHAALTKKNDGTLSLSLKKPLVGSCFTNGLFAGKSGAGQITAQVSVNGQPVIGQFVTEKKSVKKVRKEVTDSSGNKTMQYVEEEGDFIGQFFYIPEALAVPDSSLTVKVNPADNASNIDKRRIWMYRGYSALIVTLPFTFYCYGKYDAQFKGYQAGAFTDVQTIENWRTTTWISIGASCVAGSFFVYELVKYLRAADAVIPVTVKKAKSGEVEKSTLESASLAVTTQIQEQPAASEQQSQPQKDEQVKSTDEDKNTNGVK